MSEAEGISGMIFQRDNHLSWGVTQQLNIDFILVYSVFLQYFNALKGSFISHFEFFLILFCSYLITGLKQE